MGNQGAKVACGQKQKALNGQAKEADEKVSDSGKQDSGRFTWPGEVVVVFKLALAVETFYEMTSN